MRVSGSTSPTIAVVQAAGAHLTSAESMMFELLRSKDHPQFKPVSALVKRKRPELADQLVGL